MVKIVIDRMSQGLPFVLILLGISTTKEIKFQIPLEFSIVVKILIMAVFNNLFNSHNSVEILVLESINNKMLAKKFIQSTK